MSILRRARTAIEKHFGLYDQEPAIEYFRTLKPEDFRGNIKGFEKKIELCKEMRDKAESDDRKRELAEIYNKLIQDLNSLTGETVVGRIIK